MRGTNTRKTEHKFVFFSAVELLSGPCRANSLVPTIFARGCGGSAMTTYLPCKVKRQYLHFCDFGFLSDYCMKLSKFLSGLVHLSQNISNIGKLKCVEGSICEKRGVKQR